MRLGDVCEIRYGKDHKKLSDGSIPVYGSGGIMRYADRSLWDKPSVLIPRKGTLNNLFFADKPFWTVDTLFWTDIDQSKVMPRFLYYALKTKNLAELNVGTAVPSLTTDVLNEVEVDIPSLNLQESIVNLLQAFDSAIDVNSQTNDYLHELAVTLFRRWFTGENPIHPTEKMQMQEIAIVNAGGDKPAICQPAYGQDCNIPVYSNGIDNEGLYGYTTEAKITKPSVTVSARGTIGFTCLRRTPYYPIVRLISATPISRVTAEYLYLWLKNTVISGVGTTQQQLTVPMFKLYEVNVPDEDVMDQFSSLVNPLFDTIDALKQESVYLASLRDALLPKLIAGEIDVSKVVT